MSGRPWQRAASRQPENRFGSNGLILNGKTRLEPSPNAVKAAVLLGMISSRALNSGA
jgi:hypothetical protein